MSQNLIISGQTLLTMDDDRQVIENGAVLIEGDTIAAIGDREELTRLHPGARVLHREHGLVMPGLINTHTHAAMTCFRGLADDLPLMRWLEETIFPREARLTDEIVYLSSLIGLCEMIRAGTTSFCDMYLFSEAVIRATDQAGVRGWLGEVLYDFPSPCYGELDNGFALMDRLLATWRDHPLITITVNPHAVYTCSPELLTRLGRMAADHDALYHVHLSETADEVKTCRDRYGRSPVHHLEDLGLLGPRVLAAHCVVLDPGEIALLARRRVKIAHCPESNMKLASGTAPAVEMLAAGLCLSIGTDGPASNNDHDLFGEMNTMAKVHKLTRMDPTVMSGDQVLWAATRGGAEALAADHLIGSLEPGKKADLIVLDMNAPHLVPLYNPVSHLVYAARPDDVVHSVINGRLVMEDRRILSLDEEAVLAGVAEIKRFILSLD